MVAIVAMILGYLILYDLKVVLYIGIGILLAKLIYDSALKKSRYDDDD